MKSSDEFYLSPIVLIYEIAVLGKFGSDRKGQSR